MHRLDADLAPPEPQRAQRASSRTCARRAVPSASRVCRNRGRAAYTRSQPALTPIDLIPPPLPAFTNEVAPAATPSVGVGAARNATRGAATRLGHDAR